MSGYEVVLHGVPRGHTTSSSVIVPNTYFLRFYNNSLSGERFFQKQLDGNTIYTFCLYPNQAAGQNFTDQEGRTGGYVGLSIVLKGDFIDTIKPEMVFDALHKCYEKYIQNKLVLASPGGFRWAENASFTMKSPDFATVTDDMLNFIGDYISKTHLNNRAQQSRPEPPKDSGETNTGDAEQLRAATQQLQAEIAALEAQLSTKRQQLQKLQNGAQKQLD